MITNNMLILDSVWFNSIGIIMCKDIYTSEYKSYIMNIRNPSSVQKDVIDVANFGSPFPLQAAVVLMPHIKLNNLTVKEEFPEEFI